MRIKTYFMFIIFFLFIWCILCAIRPYWDKYWLEQEIKTTAIYGTKNSVEATSKFLTEKMKEQGHGFSGEDFIIEKDENNNVTISITYVDEIRVFGVSLKQLQFTVQTTVSELEARF